MSTNEQDLEARVGRLEGLLKSLIENLADNHDKLFEALRVIADDHKSGQDKLAAVDHCHGGICTNDPPGCKNKKDKDEHGHG
jgi:hypothetical protein